METYLIYYEYFLKIIVYVYMWYLGHIIGKQQILICSKVVVKSNCTVYSVQWLNTWVTHTHNTHTHTTHTHRLTHWHTETLSLTNLKQAYISIFDSRFNLWKKQISLIYNISRRYLVACILRYVYGWAWRSVNNPPVSEEVAQTGTFR